MEYYIGLKNILASSVECYVVGGSVTSLFDPVCPSSVGWSVKISLKGRKLHFHAPFGALVTVYALYKVLPRRLS